MEIEHVKSAAFLKVRKELCVSVTTNGAFALFSKSSRREKIVNSEGDYAVIVIGGGIDRSVFIDLNHPAITIVDAGTRKNADAAVDRALRKPIEIFFQNFIAKIYRSCLKSSKKAGKIVLLPCCLGGKLLLFRQKKWLFLRKK